MLFPICFLNEAHLQLPPSQMACSLGLCSWAGPGLGSQGCRENLPQEGGQGKACCPSGNLIPGPETFSICQIGFPFWFQSEDKPGPAVSGPPGCPPPLSGCLCLPPRHQSPKSHLCSLFSSLCWRYLLMKLKDELLHAAARDLVLPMAPASSPRSLCSSPFHPPRNFS